MYFPKVDLDQKFKAYADGEITTVNINDYKGKNIVLLFYPLDFTFVCPTELNVISDRREAFLKRNTVVFLISKDSVYSHKSWAKQSRSDGGVEGVQWPMISDTNGKLSKKFQLYDEEEDITKRATVILDDQFNINYIGVHHQSIGRSTDEILRLVDAMIFVSKHGDTCPMDWNDKYSK
ncbi:hypothetical protein P3W45_001075 [Vairimorpha bombi]|jgi:alkyl hydroperoxide reductase subunit AhpC